MPLHKTGLTKLAQPPTRVSGRPSLPIYCDPQQLLAVCRTPTAAPAASSSTWSSPADTDLVLQIDSVRCSLPGRQSAATSASSCSSSDCSSCQRCCFLQAPPACGCCCCCTPRRHGGSIAAPRCALLLRVLSSAQSARATAAAPEASPLPPQLLPAAIRANVVVAALLLLLTLDGCLSTPRPHAAVGEPGAGLQQYCCSAAAAVPELEAPPATAAGCCSAAAGVAVPAAAVSCKSGELSGCTGQGLRPSSLLRRTGCGSGLDRDSCSNTHRAHNSTSE